MKQIFVAKSLEEAKAQAVSDFGTEEANIKFEILEEPKKSFFGKVKGEAKIEASYEPTKTDIACTYLKKVISQMGITDVTTKVTEIDKGIVIDLEGTTLIV